VFLDACNEAVKASTWMPAEYMANDWQADVLDLLRNGPGTFTPQPAEGDGAVYELRSMRSTHAAYAAQARTMANAALHEAKVAAFDAAISALTGPSPTAQVPASEKAIAEMIADLRSLDGYRNAIGGTPEIGQMYREACCAFTRKHCEAILALAAAPAAPTAQASAGVDTSGLSELFDALDRGDRKGYLPDAIQEAWDNYNMTDSAPQPAAVDEDAAPTDRFKSKD
jgi:hypothetical protein